MVSTIPKILLAVIFIAASITNSQAEVNFASWGGNYEISQQKAYVDTWDQGSVMFHPYGGGLEEIRTQVNSGLVNWDIVDVLPHEARAGCDEGLFEDLDRNMFEPAPDGTTMDDDIMVEVPNDCVVPQAFWSYLTFYREGFFNGDQPDSIADFFNVEKFPGKRGIHAWPNALIEMALVADGVEIKDVYKVMSTEAGINRAFSRLDRIKDHVVIWYSGEMPLQMVKSGEVAMSIAFSGRVGAAILTEDENFKTIWDGQVLEEEWLVMLKGAPNAEEAKQFLVHASAPAQQAGQARYINYGPMRASAFDIMLQGEPWFHNGKNIMQHMPNRPEVMSRTIVANPEWWAEYGSAVIERYTAWISLF
ncbi:MAG: extracellular solute-binding protein [Gammaproteobacteria bacterium]|nr:extracellular solute-binding protein [Gammaproteobacteria bacterium]